jgi:hypothetical protein
MRALLSSQKEILQKLEQLEKKELEQDEKIVLIFKYLKQLEKTKQDEIEFKNRKRVGFEQKRDCTNKGKRFPQRLVILPWLIPTKSTSTATRETNPSR